MWSPREGWRSRRNVLSDHCGFGEMRADVRGQLPVVPAALLTPDGADRGSGEEDLVEGAAHDELQIVDGSDAEPVLLAEVVQSDDLEDEGDRGGDQRQEGEEGDADRYVEEQGDRRVERDDDTGEGLQERRHQGV